MPIYEYVCLDCQREFELIRSISQSDAPQTCQSCGSPKVRRKLAVIYAMSGGHAVSGMSAGCDCGSCAGGSCSSCSH